MLKNLALVSLLLFSLSGYTQAAIADDDSSSGVPGASTLSVTVQRGEPTVTASITAIQNEAKAAFEKQDFDALEAQAKKLRKTNTCFYNGTQPLEMFYEALKIGKQDSDAAWQTHLNVFKDWLKKYPKSATARAAMIDALTEYAWKARGGGFADTVTNKMHETFAARLTEAATYLEHREQLSESCPHLYSAGMTVALGQGWKRDRYDQFVSEGLKKFPGYVAIYFRKAYFLQPRWYGGAEEWVDFAKASGDSVGGAAGDKLYAQIAWHMDKLGFYPKIFDDFPSLDWPRLQRGFAVMNKDIPNNHAVPNGVAKFAVMKGDYDTAKKAFKDLNGVVDLNVWKKKVNFFNAEKECGFIRTPGPSASGGSA